MAVKDSAIITILLLTALPMLVFVSVVPNALSLPGVQKGIYVTSAATIVTTESGQISIVTTTNQLGFITTETTSAFVTTITSSTTSFSATSSTFAITTSTSTGSSSSWTCPSGYICSGEVNGVWVYCPAGYVLSAGGCLVYSGSSSGQGGQAGGGGTGGNNAGHGRGGLDLLPLALATQQPLVLTDFNGNAVQISPMTLDIAFSISLVGLILLLARKRR